jgi:hypothetical protein
LELDQWRGAIAFGLKLGKPLLPLFPHRQAAIDWNENREKIGDRIMSGTSAPAFGF